MLSQHDFRKIWVKNGRRAWMEVLSVSEGTGRLLNHQLVYFCEILMLRWFAQLHLSSELGRFLCRGTRKTEQILDLVRDSLMFSLGFYKGIPY